MESAHPDEIKKHVRGYVFVFLSLMVLTVVTVAISYLHLSVGAAIAVALVVASVKATLVACYFMHLISEKKLIYFSLIITTMFFIVLMTLPVFFYLDIH